jgi:UDP-N-acetyl-2-amino-2-deoxyglucuronate dehydrogenase
MPMRVGLLGAGNISDTHARAARAIRGVEIAAVCGANREKVARLAGAYGGIAYDDLDAFLAHRPMDIVAIGSPSGLHADQAIEAIRRGLHVLVEKPLDVTTAKVDAVIAEAGRADVKVGVFFQDRLRPDVAAMKTLIDAGRLGKPVFASGRVKWYRPPEYYGTSRWRGTCALDGGGALMNQGIHTVDLLQWLFGPVAEVCARTATRIHSIEAEDTAAAVLQFKSGALGVIEATTSVFPGYARRVELTGADGTLILEGDRLVAADLRHGVEVGTASPTDLESTASPVVSDCIPHQRVFEDFIRAIETNGTPACDAREARHSVAIVEAVYRSARQGGFQQP